MLFTIIGLCLASIATIEFPGCSTDKTTAANNILNDKQTSKDFNVKPGGTIKVELNTSGSIQIEGWNKDLVRVDLKISGMDADNVSTELNQNGNDVNIKTEYKKNKRNNSQDLDIIIKVPYKFNTKFSTMGGDINISSVDGTMTGETMGGDLDLFKLKGYLDISTMGGDITLKDSEVDGKVETMGGEVLVENVKGDINASSMGGNVRHINVSGRNKSVGKEVDISSKGGDLDVDKAPNGAKLMTMGGTITINRADKFVDALTYGGQIEIKAVDGWVKAKTLGGNIKVKMVGNPKEGKRDVSLISLHGDITLTVPNGLSMNIDIKTTGNYKIFTDFNLDDKQSAQDKARNTARKYLRGKVGDGKNEIHIETIEGNVYLKKG
jgi:uncharacterized protein YcfL